MRSVASRTAYSVPTPYTFFCSSHSPSTHQSHLARTMLVPTALDSRVNKPRTWPRQRRANSTPTFPLPFLFVCCKVIDAPHGGRPRSDPLLTLSRHICKVASQDVVLHLPLFLSFPETTIAFAKSTTSPSLQHKTNRSTPPGSRLFAPYSLFLPPWPCPRLPMISPRRSPLPDTCMTLSLFFFLAFSPTRRFLVRIALPFTCIYSLSHLNINITSTQS